METLESPLLPHLPLTVAVTGHRDVAHPDEAISSAGAFFRTLAKDYPHTPLRLLSGLAEGADRLAVKAFMQVKHDLVQSSPTAKLWQLVAVLPMDQAAYRQDFPDSIDEFDDILSAASATIVLPSPSAEDLATSQHLRDQCYEALGRHLVRHSNILFALWDGIRLDARGGTSHVVRMKLDGIQGDGQRHVSSFHDCGPVWHVPVIRARNHHAKWEYYGRWLYPAALTITRTAVEDSFRQIDILNQSLAAEVSASASMAATQWLSPTADASSDLRSSLSMFDRDAITLQGAVDTLAMLREEKRRKLTTAIYALALGVAFFLWSALDGVSQVAMAAGYALCFALAAAIYRRLKTPGLSEAPLHYRFLAEALRVQLYWSLAHAASPGQEGNTSPRGSLFEVPRVLGGLLSQQALEIGWLREALRPCALDPAGCDTVAPPVRRAHVNHWVLDQFAYFRRREARYIKLGSRLKLISVSCVSLGIAAAAATISIDLFGQNLPVLRHCLSIAAAVLPAAAILVQSYGERLAVEEQSKSSLRMQWVFEPARTFLSQHPSTADLPLVMVRALGEEALTECANWLVLRKSKPPSMPT
jgi:hypothetical protein